MEKTNETQLSAVKAHLLSGRSITPLDALNLYGCFRLGAIIFVLRHEQKMNIKTTINKTGKAYAIYTLLPPEDNGQLDLFATVNTRSDSMNQTQHAEMELKETPKERGFEAQPDSLGENLDNVLPLGLS